MRVPRKPLRGFTLVEMLVVMALLSLLMLAMTSALQTVGQTQERIDARLARSDEYRVATHFLRATLGHVSVRKVETQTPLAAGASSYLFAAAPNAVTWVGIMPAHYGAGGRYFFHLGMERVDGDTALVIRFMPWVESPALPTNWSAAESRVLVPQVTDLSIQYADLRVEPPAWTPGWTLNDRLPDRIVLDLQTTSGSWPALVVPLRPFPITEDDGGFSVGGGSK
ncbi:MAG TPA: prepilin-type N-terminal cleavage/methylation domain-containing protein [Burkholderiaceae bacterium]